MHDEDTAARPGRDARLLDEVRHALRHLARGRRAEVVDGLERIEAELLRPADESELRFLTIHLAGGRLRGVEGLPDDWTFEVSDHDRPADAPAGADESPAPPVAEVRPLRRPPVR